MAGVFISYRRSDSRGSAGRIYDNLEEQFGKDRVFRDLDALEPGARYEGAIEEFVASCDAVVAVIGNHWLEVQDEQGGRRIDSPADLVRRELEAALDHDKLVIPVLVEDAVMPKAEELPSKLAGLAGRNALPVSDSRWDYDVGRLVSVLERVLGPAHAGRRPAPDAGTPPPAAATPAPTPAPAAGKPNRGRTIALVAAGIVVVLVVLALIGGGADDSAETASTDDTELTEDELAAEDEEVVDGEEEVHEASITLSVSEAGPDDSVAISGSGFEPGETVEISLDGESAGEITADDDGAFLDAFTVPSDAESGEYEFTAEGAESGSSASATLTVP